MQDVEPACFSAVGADSRSIQSDNGVRGTGDRVASARRSEWPVACARGSGGRVVSSGRDWAQPALGLGARGDWFPKVVRCGSGPRFQMGHGVAHEAQLVGLGLETRNWRLETGSVEWELSGLIEGIGSLPLAALKGPSLALWVRGARREIRSVRDYRGRNAHRRSGPADRRDSLVTPAQPANHGNRTCESALSDRT